MSSDSTTETAADASTNASQAIRDYLQDNNDAPNKEVIAAIKDRYGFEPSAQLVSTVRRQRMPEGEAESESPETEAPAEPPKKKRAKKSSNKRAKKTTKRSAKGMSRKKKSTRSGSLTSHIIEYLEENPTAKPAEVQSALSDKGIKVSSQLIYQARTRMNLPKSTGKKKTTKRTKKTTKVTAAPAVKASGESVVKLKEAKELVAKLGGIENARQALSVLEELQFSEN
ncbi:Hypothetical protein PBC10988_1530 [Planctomycetales bacterium 10988]|nr:Hypothetical protein PBC10988_1530 [Planctomycetales bacterium 10988]